MTPREKAAYRKKYYAKNKAKELANSAKWKKHNRSLHAALNMQSYYLHQEAINERRRKTYARNATTIRARNQRWKVAHREEARRYSAKYQQDHHQWMLHVSALRRARLRGADDGTVTLLTLTDLVDRTTTCPYCKALLTTENRSLDHMQPLTKGGRHSISNLMPCCRACNSRKGNKDFSDWLLQLGVAQLP